MYVLHEQVTRGSELQEGINAKLTSIENKLTEVRLAENSLSIVVKNVESQQKTYHKAVTDMMSEQPSMSTGDVTNASSLISTESVQHIASSLAAEQREKERKQLNIIVHNIKESAPT